MRNLKVYFFIIFAVVSINGFAQQDPQFTQYMYTLLPFNPGYAGSGGICATLNFRQQWAGFTETDPNSDIDNPTTYKVAPRDILFSIHAPIRALHGGLGLSFYNDAYGHQNDIAAKLNYAFRLNIGGGTLGIGLGVDFLSRKIRNEYWGGRSGDQTIINEVQGKNDMYVDVDFGLYYSMPDKFYVGVSGTQLLSAIGGNKVDQKPSRHIYVLGGYNFVIPSNPNWQLKPSGLIKTDFKAFQMDLTLLADWNNSLLWFGASYRMVDCIALLVGTRPFANSSSAIRGLEIGVSYDMNLTSKIGQEGRTFGGFEFMVKYCFNIVKTPTTYGYKNTKLLGNRPIEYR